MYKRLHSFNETGRSDDITYNDTLILSRIVQSTTIKPAAKNKRNFTECGTEVLTTEEDARTKYN